MYDEFKNRLITYIDKHTKIGDPANLNTTLGPIGTKQNLKSLRDKVRDAIKNTDCELLYGEIDY